MSAIVTPNQRSSSNRGGRLFQSDGLPSQRQLCILDDRALGLPRLAADRGIAQRLINHGVSADTLKAIMRHKDFATTERHYGAVRSAQSAATEIAAKLKPPTDTSALVGGITKAPQLSAEELVVLKSLLSKL